MPGVTVPAFGFDGVPGCRKRVLLDKLARWIVIVLDAHVMMTGEAGFEC